eukprot:TRINITY_DN2003_c0_g1_i1.p1 TRINITY_DN2003_c0_g1~~TRINITY_DN2003_c0_g1_i1.p1  ORF type:complete len:722 (-),score=137.75 TRINITY_DN2003_c0_g1_i1:121-2286(-)
MRGISVCLVLAFLTLVCSFKIPINNPFHVNYDQGKSGDSGYSYRVGTGIYDVTGPAAEENMMGYAMPQQRTAGIHMRLRSRAFVFVDQNDNRLVYVSSDICMTFQSVKMEVIAKLQELFGDLYSHENVMLSGTHTHSGPGGFSWYALYDITSLGFSEGNFNVIVNGIVQAIVMAHKNVPDVGGQILMTRDTLNSTSINRSPTAYLNNPAEERAQYLWDVDRNITVLRIEGQNQQELGAIAWFSVHGTSMNNTNHLISSDNKGYAAYLFEKYKNPAGTLPGMGPFVAAFGQSNEGDVSPNTKGPHCPDGSPCEPYYSTCNGKNEGCIASGPGENMFESTQIIGNNQFQKALGLYEDTDNAVSLSGPIQFRHTFLNMTDITVNGNFTISGQNEQTCRAAMGYSFAAGTIDGPGAFNFSQGDNRTSGNWFWNWVGSFIAKPTPEQIACQSPKPILLDVGLHEPYPWTPDVIPIQLATIGQLVLIAVPGEFTTMSGRRVRNTVLQALKNSGFPQEPEPYAVVIGLANTYTGYITTEQEYDTQRYEGASTIFGPHTLGAYQQEFEKLAIALATGQAVPPGPTPRNLTTEQKSFLPPVIFDSHPIGKAFGDVIQDATNTYTINDTVIVSFVGANPRNNYMTQSSFLTVDIQENGNWQTVLVDGDWDTRMYWQSKDIAESVITIEWNISPDVVPGSYRITHSGYAKEIPFVDKYTFYTGASSTFTVTN